MMSLIACCQTITMQEWSTIPDWLLECFGNRMGRPSVNIWLNWSAWFLWPGTLQFQKRYVPYQIAFWNALLLMWMGCSADCFSLVRCEQFNSGPVLSRESFTLHQIDFRTGPQSSRLWTKPQNAVGDLQKALPLWFKSYVIPSLNIIRYENFEPW